MIGPAQPSCALGRMVADPLPREAFDALVSRAWIEKGLVVVRAADIEDGQLRAAMVALMTRRYGRRMRG